jgi:hypothetical protein
VTLTYSFGETKRAGGLVTCKEVADTSDRRGAARLGSLMSSETMMSGMPSEGAIWDGIGRSGGTRLVNWANLCQSGLLRHSQVSVQFQVRREPLWAVAEGRRQGQGGAVPEMRTPVCA